MSGPITCISCGEIIGTLDFVGVDDPKSYSVKVSTPCDQHKKPIIKENKFCFNLLKRKNIHYSETNTSDSWVEYIGPSNKIILLGLMLFLTKRRVNTKYGWLSFDIKHGFYGDGVQIFKE
ncbi:hypothetical protein KGV55_01760 [Candidatus Gracilibacteria bacterium]|nr:hypothetical protein [Candidatus Gracilibacteria bacterium]